MSTSTASKLDALIGLTSAKRLVLRLSRGDLGVHAMLFYGAPGSGKHALAQLLAQAWTCNRPGAEGACDECQACVAFTRANVSDFLLIQPQGPSRIIGSSQITNFEQHGNKDNLPSIRELFRTMPILARNKVVIIEDAHRMNASAANGLLKTLEEPFPWAKLILTTDSVGGVLPTILSRCLAVACELPNEDGLRQLAPSVSTDLIRISDGAPARVVEAAGRPDAFQGIADFARSLKKMPPGAALLAAEQFRVVCDALATSKADGARTTNARGLELLAVFLAREPDVPPAWTQAAIEAHRTIQGNAQATVVFDALFAKILAGPNR